jgi:hypothetical protein
VRSQHPKPNPFGKVGLGLLYLFQRVLSRIKMDVDDVVSRSLNFSNRNLDRLKVKSCNIYLQNLDSRKGEIERPNGPLALDSIRYESLAKIGEFYNFSLSCLN